LAEGDAAIDELVTERIERYRSLGADDPSALGAMLRRWLERRQSALGTPRSELHGLERRPPLRRASF
jgi:hypothetical protein